MIVHAVPNRKMNPTAIFLIPFFLLAAIAGAASLPAAAAEARKPNIIFILADDLGWGDLGCYGHRLIKSPHLDRLAKQGTLFTQFYMNASVVGIQRRGAATYSSRHDCTITTT